MKNQNAKPKPKPPNRVKIGATAYSIRFFKHLENDALGETDFEAQEINIKFGLGESITLETLFHEMIHAILYNRHPESTMNESLVDATANGLSALFVDNPKLIQYVTRICDSTAKEAQK